MQHFDQDAFEVSQATVFLTLVWMTELGFMGNIWYVVTRRACVELKLPIRACAVNAVI